MLLGANSVVERAQFQAAEEAGDQEQDDHEQHGEAVLTAPGQLHAYSAIHMPDDPWSSRLALLEKSVRLATTMIDSTTPLVT